MWRIQSQELLFYESYETASVIEATARDPDYFIEVPWKYKRVDRIICKFNKLSVLHFYIYNTLSVYKRRDFRKNPESYDHRDISQYEEAFRRHGIPFKEKAHVGRKRRNGSEDFELFYRWFKIQENSFELLWERITEEVFHLLFANRWFLLTFNTSLATYLQDNDIIPSEYRSSDGTIKRQRSVPAWLRKAVYYRDHGRCVICQRDLSGLLSTDRLLYYDHMVPLKLFGTNDPCNLQLLCDSCNSQKGGRRSTTGVRYPAWW
jgi:HNH endonuclease